MSMSYDTSVTSCNFSYVYAIEFISHVEFLMSILKHTFLLYIKTYISFDIFLITMLYDTSVMSCSIIYVYTIQYISYVQFLMSML